MSTLRLRQFPDGEKRYRVLVELETGGARREAESCFTFELPAQDQEDLRWYLEDYLQYPFDPAPRIAARIEARMSAIGKELFGLVLAKSPVWAEARHSLSDTRIEIVTGVQEATAIPWELMRDPDADAALALRARAFVRATHNAVQRPKLPQVAGRPIRVLLVICRPRGQDDVPFRSVARRLVEGLRESEHVKLTVLRPPTFERLAHVLREAKAGGKSYHQVHFDGHGVWSEDGARKGGHGYVLFENPEREGNRQPVDGPALGGLLTETGVSVLALNACQSAYAEPPERPVTVMTDNPHEETRVFGSLAQEVMDAGTAGVVAMRYSVLVSTAADFMADVYGRLIQGDVLGEAVSFGRKQLQTRGLGSEPPFQDWVVPVVFEAVPVKLFPQHDGKLTLRLRETGGDKEEGLPPRPDTGFFGRDETLLALDRTFDTQPIVLLHAYAGSGKTAAAAEFVRWYRDTGGVEGPVLFTSFEHHKPLARVLDQVGQVFGPVLEKAGVHWLALDDGARREVALQVLQQVPVLWIWDNVEPVAGFPKGTESKWKPEEQRELADFLRAARGTKAKFLLTSRRLESEWLGDELAAPVPLPPMPFQERLELARALASKLGRRLADVEDWRPLLKFTRGNPLAITVLVGQALRDGLRTREQVKAFVARLRAGEAVFEDEASEGRTRSLAASLNYGFEHAFVDVERKQLALLYLFQGFVDVDAVRFMGNSKMEWHLAEVSGLDREAGIRLLDRAAEVGLLTAHGVGYYSIHPALPWFFRRLFEEHYPDGGHPAVRAYVEAMGSLGNYYCKQYERGNREVIGALKAEEPNLLNARALARRNGWWPSLITTMQGLRILYDHTGRTGEWASLVDEIVPDFVDPASDGPLPGREDDWRLVTAYRVRLARAGRKWPEAERLQKLCVDWDRRHSRDTEPNSVRTLAASLHELGQIQREQGRPECVESYKESFELAQRIGDGSLAGVVAFNLGHAHLDLSHDLDEAERWYRKSLELRAAGDRLYRASSLAQLGRVAWERFEEARKANQPKTEVLRHLNEALQRYHEALEMTPPDAIGQVAVIHNQLGIIYDSAGDLDRSLHHWRESIRYKEAAGNLYGAATTRSNIARALASAGRFHDARAYADEAFRNYQACANAEQEIQKTLDLIAAIAKAAEGG